MNSGSIEGGRELTMAEAASILNVSIEYLAGLLDRREIPCRDSERRRRIKASDLFAYQHRAEGEQRKVLDELTTEAEKHGLGY